ncbi:MAG TPA: DUF5671 domain-containing protein [bacterium]|nr:DUF5671 domain-containing protein [bacterium]
MSELNQSPKFSFFYLLSLISLLFTALPAGMVAFQLINKWLPDPLTGYTASYTSDSLKFALSALLIAVPVYFWTMHQINRGLAKKELARKADLRRWLIYFTLLVAAVVMLGWLIALFYRYLDGELTGQFLAKSGVAIAISAIIFLFYRYDLRRDPEDKKDRRNLKLFAWPIIVVLAGLFVGGLLIAESPKQARDRRFDDRLVSNFYQIDSALSVYFERNKKLPAKLDELIVSPYFLDRKSLKASDGQEIEYKPGENGKYQLCATWRTSNQEDEGVRSVGIEKWPHQAGWQCLDQAIWADPKNTVEAMPVKS